MYPVYLCQPPSRTLIRTCSYISRPPLSALPVGGIVVRLPMHRCGCVPSYNGNCLLHFAVNAQTHFYSPRIFLLSRRRRRIAHHAYLLLISPSCLQITRRIRIHHVRRSYLMGMHDFLEHLRMHELVSHARDYFVRLESERAVRYRSLPSYFFFKYTL